MNDIEERDSKIAQEWDPLTEGISDVNWVLATRKREINNILKSYTGYFDLFAELSRGCKGVGATYLAYGFNYLLASTKGER